MDQPRLYRSSTNRIIAGVAGGIAEYLHLDPSLVRLLWVLIIFLGGAGILVYLIAWMVIPGQENISSEEYPDKYSNETPINSQVPFQATKMRQSFLLGAALIGLGLFFLLVEVFSINLHKYIWPIVLIGGGALLLFGTGRSRRR